VEPGQGSMIEDDLELGLDFTGTLDWRESEHPEESLTDYSALVAWSHKKGIIDQEEAERLREFARKDKAVVRVALKDALRLREAIFRILSSAARKRNAEVEDMNVLNEFLGRGLSKRMVRLTTKGYQWTWRDDGSAEIMLFPIASSAAKLLTSGDVARVKECANSRDGCVALFLDCSRAQTRRWCSMDSCGNRAKFRTYYERHSGHHQEGHASLKST
jgi:predicted RNA-binding Zn ribbon-like protein